MATAIPLRGWGDGMPFRMPEKPDEIYGVLSFVTAKRTQELGIRAALGVALLFLTVALVACFVPAWRASRIDPMMALRQE